MIGDGFTYRDIAEIFGIRRETAIRWVTEARREFAERHNLPLETLHLDKRPPGRKPELSEEELQLIKELTFERFGRQTMKNPEATVGITPTPSEPEALPQDEPNIPRQWARDIEQTRHTPPKRQR
jgi:hypothetical protein